MFFFDKNQLGIPFYNSLWFAKVLFLILPSFQFDVDEQSSRVDSKTSIAHG